MSSPGSCSPPQVVVHAGTLQGGWLALCWWLLWGATWLCTWPQPCALPAPCPMTKGKPGQGEGVGAWPSKWRAAWT
ncbi:hypothetical protein BJV74DRAFT_839490 [Russula compacta]|nr:hypothetical protein BJV74DRAFT_839490 [Russula compacta]